MGGFLRNTAVAIFLSAALAAPASAELVFTVNGSGGVFDQPTAVADGFRVHTAYIGGAGTSGPFLLYYALLDGSKDFSQTFQTSRSNVLLAGPFPVVDNDAVPPATPGDNVYVDARHPRIAFRNGNEIVIFFQGRPTSVSDPFILYRARLLLTENAVTAISVRKIKEGTNVVYGTDVAVALDFNDNTGRLAYAVPPGSPGGGSLLSFVRYARVGLENAAVVDTSLLLSSGIDNAVLGSDGVQPLPSITVDPNRRAHVAWSAAPDAGSTAAGIYYAMIKAGTSGNNGRDNVVIAATSVFPVPRRWSFPAIGAPASTSIFILAADTSWPGIAGPVDWVELNPEQDNQDGTPADNVLSRLFHPRSGTAFTNPTNAFYHPDLQVDSTGSSPVFVMTSYGMGSVAKGANFVVPAGAFNFVPVAAEYPAGSDTIFTSLADDYTRPGVALLDSRVMTFWSGIDPANASVHNLYFTVVSSGTRPPNPAGQSGCATAAFPRGAGAPGAADAVLILLPALLLGARKVSRSRRRRHVEKVAP